MTKTNLILVLSVFFITFTALQSMKAQTIQFTEARKDFPRVEKNLRKWDAPVVADLDQDGYVDLLLNDHGLGISVCWNNKGKFAKPYDIIMGDLHGISVGDYDMDSYYEVIMSRGGGSGGNARNSKMFRVNREREFIALPDFEVPLALMRGRTVKFLDGDNDGDLDLFNFAFPDKSMKGASENYMYKNDGQGQLVLSDTLPPSKRDGQKTLFTDFDGDGVVDFLLYGHHKVKAFRGKGDLSYEEVSKKVLPFDIKEVTGMVTFDYDNDGDLDVYLTRGKDFEPGETFYDPNSKVFGYYAKRGKFEPEDLLVGDVLNLENLQSQWPFNDAYYIGETGYPYEFEGETHSGKNIRLVNSDALGFPDQLNEEGGIHIGYIGNQKWRLRTDTWSPSTGILHGVLAYPDTEHSKGLNDILLENKNGQFIDVTQSTNLFLEAHTVAATAADFDNNGYQDLLVIQRGDLVHPNHSFLYLNKGTAGFERAMQHQIVSPELGAIGMAVEVLDYNQDGKMDVVLGNERGKWHLFKNTTATEKSNHLTVKVGKAKSGKATALGAVVTLEYCGQRQVKQVGNTGAMYSLSHDDFVHFGLGKCGESVKIKVLWSNGETLEQTVEELNRTVWVGMK